MDRENVYQVVCSVIDDVNGLLSDGQKLEKTLDSVLVGDGGRLDSLGVINLVVSLERRLDDAVGRPVSLTEEHRLLEQEGALDTVGTLVGFLEEVLQKDGSA